MLVMPFSLDYSLEGVGWAAAIVHSDGKSLNMSVSYLHDSLAELAQAGVILAGGGQAAKAVFMDEPGEHHLNFRCSGDAIAYEARWYPSRFSWGYGKDNEYEVVLFGETTLNRVTDEILKVLDYIFEDFGFERYKHLWVEHEFPRDLHLELAALKEICEPLNRTPQ